MSAGPATADVFQRAEGQWALPFQTGYRCHENPHGIAFSADRRRATFAWSEPMINYEGEIDQVAGYTVLSHDADSITMALDEESRQTEAGKPVVWILRLVPDVDGYCWGRTDWPAPRCIAVHVRCKGDTPVS